MANKKNHPQLELLHLVGEAYGSLPSRIVGITDPLAAYNFDLVVLAAGSAGRQREASQDKDEPEKQKPGVDGRPGKKKYASWASFPK